MGFQTTILGISDGSHYLVGITDDDGNFGAMPQLGTIQVCPSLSVAKDVLRKHNISSAQLTLESAYDEMCGMSDSMASNQVVSIVL